jgi:hypothetical protein
VNDGAGGRGEKKNQVCAFSLHRTTHRSPYADHSDCVLTFIHSFSILSDDRSNASSKTVPLYSAI